MQRSFIQRITSRKFISAVGGFIVMLLIFLGHPESEAAQVASLVMAGLSLISFVIGEGMADAASAATTSQPITLEDLQDAFIGIGSEDEEEEEKEIGFKMN